MIEIADSEDDHRENFAVKVAPSDLVAGLVIVSVTRNGYQWYAISVRPEELVKVRDAINAYLETVTERRTMSITKIEWCNAVWNPLAGCKEISPGCTNCYAAVMAHRLEAMGQKKYAGTTRKTASGKVVWTGKLNLDPEALQIPLKRRKPTMYFVNSMSDLFHEDVPDEFIDEVFAVMALCQKHTFQVLTKRPERMTKYFSELGVSRDHVSTAWPLPNVWLGTSCEDQSRADARIQFLIRTPAAVRFLSLEPLLGPIDLCTRGSSRPDRHVSAILNEDFGGKTAQIDWVIVGGESGPGARPCDIAWVRSVVEQCRAAGVPCFVKQLGSHPSANPFINLGIKDRKGGDPLEWPDDIRVREFPVAKAVPA